MMAVQVINGSDIAFEKKADLSLALPDKEK
jgi:hypothetical protein